MNKQPNAQILTACIFAFIFLFAILIIESCTHESKPSATSVDSTHVQIDTLQMDSLK